MSVIESKSLLREQKESNIADFSSILASSVHDMKNSLGMLLATVEEIIDQNDGSHQPVNDKLYTLQYEASRVNNNLIQMLALYKLDNSQYFLNIIEHNVAEFLEENLLQHKTLLNAKGITIETNCHVDIKYCFDKQLVSGVISNVINNAFKYTQDYIIICAHIEEDCLVISIRDNGEGYPDAMLQSSIDDCTSIDFAEGSTGLGLYFSSVVARMHRHRDRQGYISINNDDTRGGGYFSIHLP